MHLTVETLVADNSTAAASIAVARAQDVLGPIFEPRNDLATFVPGSPAIDIGFARSGER